MPTKRCFFNRFIRRQFYRRWFGLLALIGLPLSALMAASPAAKTPTPDDLHIYLLIGQSNMSGWAAIPEDMMGILERCYLLNAEGEWEPARNPLNRYSTIRKDLNQQKLGPGYSFARKMLEADPDLRIGLIVNARGGTSIHHWRSESHLYQGIRERAEAFRDSGQIKGVLWHQGESDSDLTGKYLNKLKTLIEDLRRDLNDPALPFVAGQIRFEPEQAINKVIASLPDEVEYTAVVSSEGLKTKDKWHFDTASQIELGERYAEQMLQLQRKVAAESAPQRPDDIKLIDVHVHAHPLAKGGLERVSAWMDDRRMDQCIISPLDHKRSRAYTEEERLRMVEAFKPYRGRIHRMALIEPGEYESLDEAVAYLKQEKADGVVAMGEHYGKNLRFDDPKNLFIYEACKLAGLPVMFHIDQNKNMVTRGMPEVDHVLQQFPDVKIITHAYWWRHYRDGTCDRQLSQYPNLYGDISVSGIEAFKRNHKQAREFLIKHQDKIMFGTDEGWWSFEKPWEDNPHYTLLEELNLPDAVRRKIYRDNAIKVYGLKP